jgi:hypothetical protein
MTVRNVTSLRRALEASGVSVDRIPQTIKQLMHPPISLHISAFDDSETESCIRSVVSFDRDLAARMLRLNEGKPDPDVTWTKLTRLERKRAQRLWDWAVYRPDKLSVSVQTRPPRIDSAFVLFCARVICEASGESRFKFRRPMGGGAPGGPIWRALMEALPPEFESFSESVAEIIVTSRQNKFAKVCDTLGLGPTSSDIAQHPSEFRAAVALARRSRPRKRR